MFPKSNKYSHSSLRRSVYSSECLLCSIFLIATMLLITLFWFWILLERYTIITLYILCLNLCITLSIYYTLYSVLTIDKKKYWMYYFSNVHTLLIASKEKKIDFLAQILTRIQNLANIILYYSHRLFFSFRVPLLH